MSCQVTSWADSIIVQAVADVLNLKIILIIESHPDFAEMYTLWKERLLLSEEEQCAIFIGHMYEFHYVSTDPLTSSSSIFQ